MTASWWRSLAGPGEVRVDIRAMAQGWRDRASRAETARRRIAIFSRPPAGSSITAKTRSTMPSRSWSLLPTWLYSDIASTPTASPQLAHAEQGDPALLGEADAGEQNAFAAEGHPALRRGLWRRGHLLPCVGA